jgi:hypothetical protein
MVRLADGPLILISLPENQVTTTPATTPLTIPDTTGAPEAMAMPRHSGSATRNTTNPESKSGRKDASIEFASLLNFVSM